MRQFWRVTKKIKQTHPGLLSSGVILEHDNATLHWSKKIAAKIAAFGSPNLVPPDYHLFPKLKQFLEEEWFANKGELKAMVLKCFQMVGMWLYTNEMNKLLSHYQKRFD